jgi:hypothetical protein
VPERTKRQGGLFVKQGAKFKTLGLAAALSLSVTAAAALLFSGCAGGDETGGVSGTSGTMEVSVTARPALDQEAPAEFQTATFAFG